MRAVEGLRWWSCVCKCCHAERRRIVRRIILRSRSIPTRFNDPFQGCPGSITNNVADSKLEHTTSLCDECHSLPHPKSLILFVMLSAEGSSEGRSFVAEASLYPHDSQRATKLLRLHHGQPFRHPIHRLHGKSSQTHLRTQIPSNGGFTNKYEVERLLYWGLFDDVHKAIAREKQLKGWSRVKKIALIESRNPHWVDLAKEWYPWMKGDGAGRDASTTGDRPSDGLPPLSMTEGKVR